jgi:hypothetical protein
MVCPVCFGPHAAKDCPRTCRHCGEHHHMSQCPLRCLNCQGTGHIYLAAAGTRPISHSTLEHAREDSLVDVVCPVCHGSGRQGIPLQSP